MYQDWGITNPLTLGASTRGLRSLTTNSQGAPSSRALLASAKASARALGSSRVFDLLRAASTESLLNLPTLTDESDEKNVDHSDGNTNPSEMLTALALPGTLPLK